LVRLVFVVVVEIGVSSISKLLAELEDEDAVLE
jgi:hypothetical protein